LKHGHDISVVASTSHSSSTAFTGIIRTTRPSETSTNATHARVGIPCTGLIAQRFSQARALLATPAGTTQFSVKHIRSLGQTKLVHGLSRVPTWTVAEWIHTVTGWDARITFHVASRIDASHAIIALALANVDAGSTGGGESVGTDVVVRGWVVEWRNRNPVAGVVVTIFPRTTGVSRTTGEIGDNCNRGCNQQGQNGQDSRFLHHVQHRGRFFLW